MHIYIHVYYKSEQIFKEIYIHYILCNIYFIFIYYIYICLKVEKNVCNKFR